MSNCTTLTPTFSIDGIKNTRHERIKLQDTTLDILMKMSEKNPGAMTVCMKILDVGADIDPDDFMGSIGAIISLDSCGIYGSRIWMLYKDVCKENIVNTIATLRACQLGFLSRSNLNTAIDNHGKGINVEELYKQVKKQLPKFNSKEKECKAEKDELHKNM